MQNKHKLEERQIPIGASLCFRCSSCGRFWALNNMAVHGSLDARIKDFRFFPYTWHKDMFCNSSEYGLANLLA